MPGGVAGAQPTMAAPYADFVLFAFQSLLKRKSKGASGFPDAPKPTNSLKPITWSQLQQLAWQ